MHVVGKIKNVYAAYSEPSGTTAILLALSSGLGSVTNNMTRVVLKTPRIAFMKKGMLIPGTSPPKTENDCVR